MKIIKKLLNEVSGLPPAAQTKIDKLRQLYRDLDALEQDLKSIGGDLTEVRRKKAQVWADITNFGGF